MELPLEETLNKSTEVHKVGYSQEGLQANQTNSMEVEGSNFPKPNILDTLKLDKALRLAKRKLKDGQLEEAKSIYEDILQRFSKHKQALIALKSLTGGITAIPQDPPSDQLQPIINHYTQGQLKQALSHATEMLAKFPNSLTLYDFSGASNLGLMQYDAAIACYKQVIRIKPDCAQAYYNIGNALNDKGDLEAAIVSYKQAVKIEPDYAEAFNNMGNALQDKGDSEAAINSHKRAIKIKPDYADAYINMGNSLMGKGSLDKAIDSYNQALKIKPDLADAYYNMGVALNRKGDLDVAIDNYNQALKINPEYAEVYNNKGIALQDNGDIKAAIKSYEQALKIKPDYVEAHYNYGLLLFADNEYEKAVEHFKFSDFGKSKYYLLRCFYLQDKKSLFYDQLDYFINQDEIHPIIGSLGCRAELRYGIEKLNLFCKDPLNYVLKNDLSNLYDFDKIFVKTARTILNENRIPIKPQRLLTNGNQTSGDLFSLQHDLTEDIQKIIRLEIEKYKVDFKHSTEGLITGWPTDYSLRGWLVSMKSGGKLQPHMHESGWISGSVYINVPPKSETNSGNLVVCIEENRLSGKNTSQEKIIDVVTGSLCLFPASLLHYTIPFESEEDRIVLAFDVVPKW